MLCHGDTYVSAYIQCQALSNGVSVACCATGHTRVCVVGIALRNKSIKTSINYLFKHMHAIEFKLDMLMHRLLYKWTMLEKSPSITTDPNTVQH